MESNQTQKKCLTCGELRLVSDFNKHGTAKDGLQHRCRACCREWYLVHKEEHKANTRRNKKAHRTRLKVRMVAFLAKHECLDCGESDLRVLEFDHRDPSKKIDEVTRLVTSAASWELIQAEIDKCDVRCANCHRIRTLTVLGAWRCVAERTRVDETRDIVLARLSSLVGKPVLRAS